MGLGKRGGGRKRWCGVRLNRCGSFSLSRVWLFFFSFASLSFSSGLTWDCLREGFDRLGGGLGGRGGREGFDWEKGPYGCECKKDEQAGKTNILESE